MKIRPVIVVLLPVLGLLLLVACSQDSMNTSGTDSHLELNIGIDQPDDMTRAASQVTSTYFPTGTQLGVTVQKTDGTVYPSHEHTNVLFSAMSTGSAQLWGSTGIDLTAEAARVSAYYPYDTSFDPAAIPINCDAQTDWMYCPWTDRAANNGTINEDNRVVSLTMRHAQAIIKYQLTNVSYTNEGQVYRLDIKGRFGRKGVLNSYTGALSDVDETAFISEQYGTPLDFKTDGATNQWYVLPTPDIGEQDVTLYFYIDGVEYRTTVTANLEQGKVYTFNLKMNDSYLSVASVECEGWVEGLDKSKEMIPYIPIAAYDGVLMYSDDDYDYYWAEYNVGGSLIEPFGKFYRLGETAPFTSQSVPYTFDYSNITYIARTEFDAATWTMGDDWQIPTEKDWQNLASKCDYSAYDADVKGYIISSTEYPGNQIVIYCAGVANSNTGERTSEGYVGNYWADYEPADYYLAGWRRMDFENSYPFNENIIYSTIVPTPTGSQAYSIRAVRKVAKN